MILCSVHSNLPFYLLATKFQQIKLNTRLYTRLNQRFVEIGVKWI